MPNHHTFATAKERAAVVVAWRRVNEASLPVDVDPADHRLLRRAGVLLPGRGETWCSEAAANARSLRQMLRQMLDVLRSLKK